MWLFSSSPAAIDGGDDARGTPPAKDEGSSAIETPQPSYAAVNDGNDRDDGVTAPNGGGNGAIHGNAAVANSDMAPPQKLIHEMNGHDIGQVNGIARQSINESSTSEQRRKQRGVVYFRRIQPADRAAIQELHERWFPVDYKSDFFDALCHGSGGGEDVETSGVGVENGVGGGSGGGGSCGDGSGGDGGSGWGEKAQRRRRLPGAFGTEPLYCCVACFRELSDAEYEERARRRDERNGGGRRNASGWGSSFLSSSARQSNKKRIDSDGYDDADCLLWELDDRSDDGGGSDRSDNDNENCSDREASSMQTVQRPQYASMNGPAQTEEGDAAIEGGESKLSVHHRTEKEKIKQFYANGFRYVNEAENDSGGTNDDTQQTQNSNGERIIGCIVGSFLPSCPQTHVSLNQKPSRDETSSLLVPDRDVERYTRVFYIMTLGTSREFRRCGLGSVLVERVASMIEREREECGALYLHVITYNEGAIRLYERLGFARVREIEDYYTINSVNYDCYLYARYFHGNRGHKTTLGVLYDLATSILRKLGHALIPS